MNVPELYHHILHDTDPKDPTVAEEIKKGMRWPYGLTDVQAHLPLLREEAHGNVLEIGVRFGASTIALLLGVQENGGHLWSIDISDCRIIEHSQWTFIQADSRKDADRIKRVIPEELDLLFIDGDHSFDGVSADLENYGFRAKKIMLHDSQESDVSNAIKIYRMEGSRQRKITWIIDSHGLAILS